METSFLWAHKASLVQSPLQSPPHIRKAAEVPRPESNSVVTGSRWEELAPSPRLVGVANLAASALLGGSWGGMVVSLTYKKQRAHQ